MFDICIRGGALVDGTGNPPYLADLAIQGDCIAAIGRLDNSTAAQTIDATGQVVTPGFIDIHTHAELDLFIDPRAEALLSQGVTTALVGNCGSSAAPVPSPDGLRTRQWARLRAAGIEASWGSFGTFLDALAARRPAVNVASLVGHGTIRTAVVGAADRGCSAGELATMKRLLAQSLDEGAFGLSTGLEYIPGMSADASEIIEMCRVTAAYDRLYATHMRQRDWRAIQSTQEAVDVAAAAAVRLQVSHLTPRRWRPDGALESMIRILEDADRQGVETHWDCVVRDWGVGGPYSLVARWALDGTTEERRARLADPQVREQARRWVGVPAIRSPQWKFLLSDDWEQVYLYSCQKSQEYLGLSLAEIAERQGTSPQDALFDLFLTEGETMPSMVFCGPSHYEDDLRLNIGHPKSMPISDGGAPATTGPLAGGRNFFAYGWVARVLQRYVREERIMSLPEAVRKMTSYPAWKLRLTDRGLLREGMKADVAIFDPDQVQDLVTPWQVSVHPPGFGHTIVNGQVAFAQGTLTGNHAGTVFHA